MGNPRRSNGARRSALLKWLRAQGRPCWVCGLPIDYGLPPGLPGSFECDEIVPVSRGGSPYDRGNVDAAHRICNGWRSARMPPEVEAARADVLASFGQWSTPEEFVAGARAACRGKGPRTMGLFRPVETTTEW